MKFISVALIVAVGTLVPTATTFSAAGAATRPGSTLPVPWSSIPTMGTDDAAAQGFDGSGWSIIVDDSGVDATHQAVAGRVVDERCLGGRTPCAHGRTTARGPGQAATCSEPNATYECDHGTAVAGVAVGNGPTITGVATGSTLIAIRDGGSPGGDCFGDGPRGTCVPAIDELAAALDAAKERPVAAEVMSWGFNDLYDTHCDENDPYFAAQLQTLRNAGVAPIVAAGNDSEALNVTRPACLRAAIAVGSLGTDGKVAPESDRGPLVDFYAPGANVLVPTGRTDNYEVVGGTSLAAPAVAGAFAIARQARPDASVDLLLGALRATGSRVTDPRSGFAAPTIDVGAAVRLLRDDQPLAVPVDDDVNVRADATSTLQVGANDGSTSSSAAHLVDVSDQPIHGRVSCTSTGACHYTPRPGFVGQDMFRYRSAVGSGPATTGQVLITVEQRTTCAAIRLQAVSKDGGRVGVTVDGHGAVGTLAHHGRPLRYQPSDRGSEVSVAADGEHLAGVGWLKDSCDGSHPVTVIERSGSLVRTRFTLPGWSVSLTQRVGIGTRGAELYQSYRFHNTTTSMNQFHATRLVDPQLSDAGSMTASVRPSAFSVGDADPLVLPYTDSPDGTDPLVTLRGQTDSTRAFDCDVRSAPVVGGAGFDEGVDDQAVRYQPETQHVTGAEVWLGRDRSGCVPPTGYLRASDQIILAREDMSKPIALARTPDHNQVGQSVRLDAGDSVAAKGSRLVRYEWNLTGGHHPDVSTTRAVTRFTPSRPTPHDFSPTLTVVDDHGRSDTIRISRIAPSTASEQGLRFSAISGSVAVTSHRTKQCAYARPRSGRALRYQPIDSTGAFTIKNLPAGRYLVVAADCPSPQVPPLDFDTAIAASTAAGQVSVVTGLETGSPPQ